MSQRDRRREPYPWTWEPAALVSATLLAVLVVAVQTGSRRRQSGRRRSPGAAADAAQLGDLHAGLLGGDAGAGLRPPSATSTAVPFCSGGALTGVGLVLVGLLLFAAVGCWRRFGRGGVQGMATPVRSAGPR